MKRLLKKMSGIIVILVGVLSVLLVEDITLSIVAIPLGVAALN